jgi:hypothetical protein
MKQERLNELIGKFNLQQATSAEIEELHELYDQFDEKPGYTDQLGGKQRENYRDKLFARIRHKIIAEEQKALQPARTILKLGWVTTGLAASVIICLTFAGYQFLKRGTSAETVQLVTGDLPPGSVGATLKFGNGKTIKLADAAEGAIANEKGVIISKSKGGKLVYKVSNENSLDDHPLTNTLSTAKGETYQLKLPDGTVVFLNASSTLEYPENFSGTVRRVVKLTGEAYFEVAKDGKHPFVVKTVQQQIEVLGTHFNVNSYPDETNTQTTLLEGSVNVTRNNDRAMRHLSPGQQSILDPYQLVVHDADVDEAVAWKNGDFDFNKEDLRSIMRKLARWYNIEVVYSGNIHESTFTGKISRSKNISQVLKMLSKTKTVHFKIQERRVIVTE